MSVEGNNYGPHVHGGCINFSDGVCKLTGIPVDPLEPACSKFTPREKTIRVYSPLSPRYHSSKSQDVGYHTSVVRSVLSSKHPHTYESMFPVQISRVLSLHNLFESFLYDITNQDTIDYRAPTFTVPTTLPNGYYGCSLYEPDTYFGVRGSTREDM